MKIEFDPKKSEKNNSERRIPYEWAADFDWENAIYAEDDRKEYPERRYVAIGYLASDYT